MKPANGRIVGSATDYVGMPLPRANARRLLTGRGHYVDDIRLPRLAHVAFVRSPYARARIAALAVTSATRSSALQEVPTLAESGLPGFDITQWFAVWVPAKTPKDVIDRLNAEVVKIVHTPEYKRRMTEAGTEAVGSTADYLGKLQRSEIEKYRKIAGLSGIIPE